MEQEKENKTTIILYCLTELLEYGFIYPKDIIKKFNISERTIYRYINEIRKMLEKYEFKNFKIEYEKFFGTPTYKLKKEWQTYGKLWLRCVTYWQVI